MGVFFCGSERGSALRFLPPNRNQGGDPCFFFFPPQNQPRGCSCFSPGDKSNTAAAVSFFSHAVRASTERAGSCSSSRPVFSPFFSPLIRQWSDQAGEFLSLFLSAPVCIYKPGLSL